MRAALRSLSSFSVSLSGKPGKDYQCLSSKVKPPAAL